MIIRPATAEDAQGIAAVHVRSWQSAYRGQLPQEFLDALDPAQRAVRWRSLLEGTVDPGERTLVAEAAGELVGFAHVRPTRDDDNDPVSVGEVTSIYLMPASWRQGIGSRLTTAALDQLRATGHTSATLWVLSTNLRAVRFYESAGWQSDGAAKEIEIAGTSRTELRYRHPL